MEYNLANGVFKIQKVTRNLVLLCVNVGWSSTVREEFTDSTICLLLVGPRILENTYFKVAIKLTANAASLAGETLVAAYQSTFMTFHVIQRGCTSSLSSNSRTLLAEQGAHS